MSTQRHLAAAPAVLWARLHLALKPLAVVLAGSAMLALSARVQVPFAPLHIPFTLQPPAVLCLAAVLGRRQALASVLLTLALAAGGAPVLAGPAGVAALMGLRAGYLWGFVAAAAYLGGGRRSAHLGHWLVAAVLLLACGWARLVPVLGARQAFAAGVAPFLFADCAKATVAMALCRGLNRLRRRA